MLKYRDKLNKKQKEVSNTITLVRLISLIHLCIVEPMMTSKNNNISGPNIRLDEIIVNLKRKRERVRYKIDGHITKEHP